MSSGASKPFMFDMQGLKVRVLFLIVILLCAQFFGSNRIARLA
jgi:hypothetical protein